MSTEEMRDQALTEQANKGHIMIWVTFRKEGLHKYPAALDDPKLATGDEYDVSFLGYVHRHIFHFKVAIEVTHDDRDIEFIQFKRWIENMYADGTMKLDFKSCEMISDDLYVAITKRYPGRKIEIDVSEDGENGIGAPVGLPGRHRLWPAGGGSVLSCPAGTQARRHTCNHAQAGIQTGRQTGVPTER